MKMLTIKQTQVVVKEGGPCEKHLFFTEKSKWSIAGMSFSQQRVCMKCGRVELNASELVRKKIAFADIVNHFHGE
jgi:hypothetical protein